ncbi:hypothetical protein SEA_PSONYX_115 [Corynebacterium phage PSonyx]|nr:hypothetical protein SEA_PSONYX_115 [Corynebacterium phage PSonyx]
MKITRKTSTTFHIAHGKKKIVIMCDRLVPTVTVDGRAYDITRSGEVLDVWNYEHNATTGEVYRPHADRDATNIVTRALMLASA